MVSEFVLNIVQAANNIRSNVWSIMLILSGISLVLHGHESVGSSLVTGAFAVFRSSNADTAPIPPNAVVPVAPKVTTPPPNVTDPLVVKDPNAQK